MNKPMRKNKLIKMINNSNIDLPTPNNLSTWWNFGSILGMYMAMQMISGILLSMHYSANMEMAFNTIMHISRDVNYGWMMRTIHSNGASLMFTSMFMHVGRGIYYGSYKLTKTWVTGIMIMLTSMATAFLGYVLPWGQMSFWGATVITNLLSAIPYVGNTMVLWMWGGFSVNNATLSRFFSLHFTLPFILLMMITMHLIFLHNTGSMNPLGLKSDMDKIPFQPYFSIKDIMGFTIILTMMLMLNMTNPYILSDPDNFTLANPLNTPIHIQPEWYFLFAYAILRSIPNKLGGVMALIMSILITLILPVSMKMKFNGLSFYPISQMNFWLWISTTILLTWIGSKPVEMPFSLTSMMLTKMYFGYFSIDPLMTKMWDKMIK